MSVSEIPMWPPALQDEESEDLLGSATITTKMQETDKARESAYYGAMVLLELLKNLYTKGSMSFENACRAAHDVVYPKATKSERRWVLSAAGIEDFELPEKPKAWLLGDFLTSVVPLDVTRRKGKPKFADGPLDAFVFRLVMVANKDGHPISRSSGRGKKESAFEKTARVLSAWGIKFLTSNSVEEAYYRHKGRE